MQQLYEKYFELIDNLPQVYERLIFSKLIPSVRIGGIIGPRGVGKTTFLLHYLKKNFGSSKKALYVSADSIYFTQNSLYETANQFHRESAGELICIDEIHRYPNWEQELKNIYDSIPTLKVLFSGSSSINLIKGQYDLSRRAILRNLYGLSFREYLEIETKANFPVLQFESLVKDSLEYSRAYAKQPGLIGLFKDYLKKGYYLFRTEEMSEPDFLSILCTMLDKAIYQDIASFYNVPSQNLVTFKNIIQFLVTSPPGGISIHKLAKSLQHDSKTIQSYLEMMRASGLLRFLINDKRGHSLIRSAEKIYLENCNLLQAVNHELGKEPDLGTVRELFVINQLENSGQKVFFSEIGDISCNQFIFEIGGKGKDFSQLIQAGDFGRLVKDDILIPGPKSIPIYLFGTLY